MNLVYKTRRFFVPFCFLFGLAVGQAQTDLSVDNGVQIIAMILRMFKVGDPTWTGCAGMYIVANVQELKDATNYTITPRRQKHFHKRAMLSLFQDKGSFNDDIGTYHLRTLGGLV